MPLNYAARKLGIYKAIFNHYVSQADKLYRKKEFEKAIEAYHKALNYDRINDHCRFYLGLSHKNLSNYAAACELLGKISDRNYYDEALALLRECNRYLIAEGTKHLTEAEKLLTAEKSDIALVEFSQAVFVLPNIDAATPLRDRSIYFIRQIEWPQKRSDMKYKLSKSMLIEDLQQRSEELKENIAFFAPYTEYFSSEDSHLYQQASQLLKTTDSELRLKHDVEVEDKITRKFSEFLFQLGRYNYTEAKNIIQSIIYDHDKIIKPEDEDHMSIQSLEQAIQELETLRDESDTRCTFKIEIIVNAVIERLRENNKNNNVPARPIASNITNLLENQLKQNWHALDQNYKPDFESGLFALVSECTEVKKTNKYSGSCITFQASENIVIKNTDLFKAKVADYIDGYIESNSTYEIKIALLHKLKEAGITANLSSASRKEQATSNEHKKTLSIQ